MAEFQRDPLTAPIPIQALVAVPSRPWQPAALESLPDAARSRRARADVGRHHLHLEPAAAGRLW